MQVLKEPGRKATTKSRMWLFIGAHHTKEVLFIRKGKLRVDLYNDQQEYLESKILEDGDVILLANGGHGFEVLEDVAMFEVKQGPYIDDGDVL